MNVSPGIIVKPKSPRRMDCRLLISVVFTEPQVACVGLTEKEATARCQISRGELTRHLPVHYSVIEEIVEGFVEYFLR
jgi:pyruvate/2-oxoglutarate dehydrogenase complex dihydrolipoamide dehydrogenase (E3) component